MRRVTYAVGAEQTAVKTGCNVRRPVACLVAALGTPGSVLRTEAIADGNLAPALRQPYSRPMRNLPFLILLAVVLVAAASCQRRGANKWDAPAEGTAATAATSDAAPAVADTRKIILFAPVATGPLTPMYKDAKLDFAYELANRVDLLGGDADGRAGEHLPLSDADDWTKGRVPETAGANLVVLTRILKLETLDSGGGPNGRESRIQATVDMRGLDVNGFQVFAKKAVASASTGGSPKLMGDAARPESTAAWNACSTAVGALITFIKSRNDLATTPSTETGPSVVLVPIDSDPAKADVLTDGQFKGTTPMKLTLPTTKPVTVRIERQGYQPWERTVTPSAQMRIQPALIAVTTAPAATVNEPAPIAPPLNGTEVHPTPAAPMAADGATAPATEAPAPVDPLLNPPTPAKLAVPADAAAPAAK